MILFLFLPLELLLGPDHNLKSYYVILHFQTTKSHNFSIIRNLYHFFFPYQSVKGPTTQVGLIGLWQYVTTALLAQIPDMMGITASNRNTTLSPSNALPVSIINSQQRSVNLCGGALPSAISTSTCLCTTVCLHTMDILGSGTPTYSWEQHPFFITLFSKDIDQKDVCT